MRTVLLGSVALVLGSTVSGCSGGADFGESRTEEGLAFASVIQGASDHVVTFRQVLGQDFDLVTVACPLMAPDDVKTSLGFNWSAAKDLPLQDESVNAVVLSQDSKVVHVEVVKRLKVDLCPVGDIGVVSVDPAKELHFSQAENSDGTTGWAVDSLDASK